MTEVKLCNDMRRPKHWQDPFRPLIVCVLLLLCTNVFSDVPPGKDESPSKSKIAAQVKLSHDKIHPGSTCFALLIVTIQDGWHINSATPSEGNLVATSVDIRKAKVLDSVSIRYPAGIERKFDFSDTALDVYEGTIQILLRLRIRDDIKRGEHTIAATIGYQACSNSICLAPTTVRINIPLRVVTSRQPVHRVNNQHFEPYKEIMK